MPNNAPIYSLDASAVIWLKEQYRFEVTHFQTLWERIGDLGEEGRVRIAEEARNECHDQVLQDWFNRYPNMVEPFSAELNTYVNALNADLASVRLPLVDPQSTDSLADPFVVALALQIEQRPIGNLGVPGNQRCHVVSYEAPRMRARGFARIPLVCQHYGLRCLEWPDLFQIEGW